MGLPTILREANAQSDLLDIEVCGGRAPKHNAKAEYKAAKAERVALYGSQWKALGDQGPEANMPAEGGEIHYDVNELQQSKFELAFCGLMVKVGIMEPFE